ncbi:MAG: hypothetical protein LUD03_05285, partial [Firmicutes bacterium]|nr:hypothetical protein [Bacillota bacterium]
IIGNVVTLRQTMKREVAARKRRFFRGECPIQETGRQSRYYMLTAMWYNRFVYELKYRASA